jgi:hypothetical protein
VALTPKEIDKLAKAQDAKLKDTSEEDKEMEADGKKSEKVLKQLQALEKILAEESD